MQSRYTEHYKAANSEINRKNSGKFSRDKTQLQISYSDTTCLLHLCHFCSIPFNICGAKIR